MRESNKRGRVQIEELHSLICFGQSDVTNVGQNVGQTDITEGQFLISRNSKCLSTMDRFLPVMELPE